MVQPHGKTEKEYLIFMSEVEGARCRGRLHTRCKIGVKEVLGKQGPTLSEG